MRYQRSRYEQAKSFVYLGALFIGATPSVFIACVRAVGGGINLPFNDKQVKQIYQESAWLSWTHYQMAQTMNGQWHNPKSRVCVF